MKTKKVLTEEEKKEIKEFNDWCDEVINKADYVKDGIYDITDIDYFMFDCGRVYPKDKKEFREFVEKYPNFVIADPYETEQKIALSEMPTKKVKYNGSGFNHGSSNIIANCPSRILICAEND
jgi:glycerol-3-phosphate cytidylyltransferase-like family protein